MTEPQERPRPPRRDDDPLLDALEDLASTIGAELTPSTAPVDQKSSAPVPDGESATPPAATDHELGRLIDAAQAQVRAIRSQLAASNQHRHEAGGVAANPGLPNPGGDGQWDGRAADAEAGGPVRPVTVSAAPPRSAPLPLGVVPSEGSREPARASARDRLLIGLTVGLLAGAVAGVLFLIMGGRGPETDPNRVASDRGVPEAAGPPVAAMDAPGVAPGEMDTPLVPLPEPPRIRRPASVAVHTPNELSTAPSSPTPRAESPAGVPGSGVTAAPEAPPPAERAPAIAPAPPEVVRASPTAPAVATIPEASAPVAPDANAARTRPAEVVARVQPRPRVGMPVEQRSAVVEVQVQVDRTGRPARVRAVSGPSALRLLAEDAVARWTFEPALQDGEPVDGTLRVSVTFGPAIRDMRFRRRSP